MSETVWKYPFDLASSFTLALPRGAEILHVADQAGQPCLWARVDPAQPLEPRRFAVVGTGHPLPRGGKDQVVAHVATFLMHPFVWHLFELY